ncbi:MAG: cation-transporting P-type ATPase [Hyphomicrobiaceae bacterium]
MKARQTSEGFNELPRPDQQTTLRIFLEVVREPMLALLLGTVLLHRPLTHLGGMSRRFQFAHHGSSLSRVGASGNSGAVHPLV